MGRAWDENHQHCCLPVQGVCRTDIWWGRVSGRGLAPPLWAIWGRTDHVRLCSGFTIASIGVHFQIPITQGLSALSCRGALAEGLASQGCATPSCRAGLIVVRVGRCRGLGVEHGEPLSFWHSWLCACPPGIARSLSWPAWWVRAIAHGKVLDKLCSLQSLGCGSLFLAPVRTPLHWQRCVDIEVELK